MGRLYFSSVAVLLLYCSFLYAQAETNYQQFVEAQIVPSQTFTIDDIAALPKAPGSDMEILNDGSVKVQIPADIAIDLSEQGNQIKTLRKFVLIEPSGIESEIQSATVSYEYGENLTDYAIPNNGSWTHSEINFSALPPNIITSIDMHCYMESSWIGYITADLTDIPITDEYRVVTNASGYISIPRTGIITFNGKTLNRTWALWACEPGGTGGAWLDYWWIKIYYTDPAPYCPASGGCDEYIYEVIVGDIDNVSDCNYYADYTDTHSTSMTVGSACPIEIVTAIDGEPYWGYQGDRCGIWIDWNQDNDFDDTGEMVFSEMGIGEFTTEITPPADALQGQTRMRIRLAYNETLIPCGSTPTGGEVEDYTINVLPGDIPGDFAPPEGVDFIDFSILAKQWMLEKLSFDVVPTGGDGIVNFPDFALFAQTWQGDYNQLYGFASQWLMKGMYNADIAPLPAGDGIVDFHDLKIFAENWLVDFE